MAIECLGLPERGYRKKASLEDGPHGHCRENMRRFVAHLCSRPIRTYQDPCFLAAMRAFVALLCCLAGVALGALPSIHDDTTCVVPENELLICFIGDKGMCN